jgi:hypothetical protein
MKSCFYRFKKGAITSCSVLILSGIILLSGMYCNFVWAADVYVSLTGTKTSGKSTAGDWSNANSYNNLRAAMAAASGGDTITINDGTYTGVNNLIDSSHVPPSGTASVRTIIQARNIPCQNGVACSQPLLVNFDDQGSTSNGGGIWMGASGTSNYVTWKGINFKGSVMIWGPNHWYFKQCSVVGDADGNNAAITVANSTYDVFEDFVIMGKGRYHMLWYDENRSGFNFNGVCRRCIMRQDWKDDANNPSAGYVLYFGQNVKFINSMDIDGSPANWTNDSELYWGSFAQVVENGTINMSLNGSMAINTPGNVFGTRSNTSGFTITDFLGYKIGGGFLPAGNTAINRATLLNVGYNNFTYPGGITDYSSSSGLTGSYKDSQNYFAFLNSALNNFYGSSSSIYNSIIRTVQGSANIAGSFTQDYINTYAITGSDISPSHHITTDPYTQGLLYPVRIESGSTLATAGQAGGQVGANITQILGTDGAEYGTSNVETPQGSLWPWPYEGWVKAQFGAMSTTITGDTMPSPTRGFASPTAKRLDGVNPVTLTSYIWESLGNPIPTSLYSTAPAVSSPTVTLKSSSPL